MSMRQTFKVCFYISFICYVLALIMLLFIGVMFVGMRGHALADVPLVEYLRSSPNFVPFRTIRTYAVSIVDEDLSTSIAIKNLLGNVILFLPMGIYLPYYIENIKGTGRFTLSMIALLFLVEAIQLVTQRGSFDIDDFILNIVGAFLGYGLWNSKVVQKMLVPQAAARQSL